MTNRIGLVYAENDTQLSGPIGLGVVCHKTKQDNDVTDHTSAVYAENKFELSLPIKSGAVCHENQR